MRYWKLGIERQRERERESEREPERERERERNPPACRRVLWIVLDCIACLGLSFSFLSLGRIFASPDLLPYPSPPLFPFTVSSSSVFVFGLVLFLSLSSSLSSSPFLLFFIPSSCTLCPLCPVFLRFLVLCTLPKLCKKKHVNYFTSCDPHHDHDIYTFCYWQIFWHSI